MPKLTVERLRPRRRKVPLRIGDVWVYLGPATEVCIVGLAPRPTFQKPDSQAVTLNDGRTITEATLRSAYQRKQEYIAYLPILRAKWELAKAEFYGIELPCAQIIRFPPRKTTSK